MARIEKKDICTVAKIVKVTLDLAVTLTFDLLKIYFHLMNAQSPKYVHTKFGKAMFESLCDTAADGGTEGRVTGHGHLPIVVPS